MNRILATFVTAVVLMTTINATEIITDKTKLQEISKKSIVFQDPSLTLIAAIERPYSYILKLEAKGAQGSQNITAYLGKQSGNIHFGTAYDKKGNPLTFPADAKTIKEGVAFSYGKGNKEIYIVTDPECPYCTRFEKAIKGKLDDYTVHVILMPLSFHKKAPAMIEWIMQSKDDTGRKERFEELMLKGSTTYEGLIKDAKKPFVYSKAVGQTMKKVDKATRELKVRGTPAIYDANFNPVEQGQLLNNLPKGIKK